MKKAVWLGLFLLMFCMAAGAGFAQGVSDKQLAAQQEAQVRAAAEMTAAQQAYLAEAVVTQREGAGGRTFEPQYRASLVRNLASLSVGTLQAMQSNGGYSSDAVVPENLGDSGADLVYTPITPFRIIDTRLAGGIIAANSTRSFWASGTGFAGQGGGSGDSGVPYGPATAVMINYVVVGPTGSGDLRAWPYLGTMPLASAINYIPNQNVANGIIQPICDPAVNGCTFDITVRADSRAVHLVADVVGYFRKFRKEQVKSFVVTSQSNSGVTIGATCTNYMSVTVVAPGPGRVLVRGNTEIFLSHVNGAHDQFEIHIGSSATDCVSSYGYGVFVDYPASLPTGTYFPWPNPFRVFDVGAAGSVTYYLNGLNDFGTSGSFWWGGMEATFIPN